MVRVRLDPTGGSEQRRGRPGLTVSPGLINENRSILVAILTTRKTHKRRTLGRYGRVSSVTLRRVDAALKIAAGLTSLS